MSTVQTTNIKHAASASNNITLDASGNVGMGTGSPAANSVTLTRASGFVWYLVQSGANNAYLGLDASSAYLGTLGAQPVQFQTSSLERMRIDSAGNVGIGTSSPSSFGKFAVTGSGGTVFVGSSGQNIVFTNGGTNFITTQTAGGQILFQTGAGSNAMIVDASQNVGIGTTTPGYRLVVSSNGGTDATFISATGGAAYVGAVGAKPLVFETNGTERARITSAGNVGIGTSSPATRLDVVGNARVITTSSGVAATFGTNDGGANNNALLVVPTYGNGVVAANGMYLDLGTAGMLGFRATAGGIANLAINSNGDVLVGTTSTFDNVSFNKAQVSGGLSTFINTTGATTQISFFNPNGRVGWVGTSGTSTSYNTSSDYRLKENVVPLAGASARVATLKPYRFNFIGDPAHTVDGFIAHEAAEVVPEAVTGEKDAVDADGKPIYQGIDQSKLVPLLTAALQEALTEIAALKARVATLENK